MNPRKTTIMVTEIKDIKIWIHPVVIITLECPQELIHRVENKGDNSTEILTAEQTKIPYQAVFYQVSVIHMMLYNTKYYNNHNKYKKN